MREVDSPVPGPGEIVIQVAVCGVNFPDLLIVQDRYQVRPTRPFAPGSEVAGVVSAVGSEVDAFSTGDRVVAICSWGGMSEQVLVKQEHCLRLPEAMPFDIAAALPMTYGTAYYALSEAGHAQAGQTVLVLGASGGVGLAAVELGKAMGATVVAAVSNERKAAVARASGADEVVVYARGLETRDEIRALGDLFRQASRGGPNLILDPVGGAYSEPALRSIRSGGRYVVIGFAGGIGSVPLNLVLFNHATVVGAPYGAVVAHQPEDFRRTTLALFDLFSQGLVMPRITRRFALADGAKALSSLGSRTAIGKVVVEVADWRGAAGLDDIE
jgi:NADPH:quinone reductase-like Zn-dependent oxidoreductase